jgi:hypothetical protein
MSDLLARTVKDPAWVFSVVLVGSLMGFLGSLAATRIDRWYVKWSQERRGNEAGAFMARLRMLVGDKHRQAMEMSRAAMFVTDSVFVIGAGMALFVGALAYAARPGATLGVGLWITSVMTLGACVFMVLGSRLRDRARVRAAAAWQAMLVDLGEVDPETGRRLKPEGA